ncbi:hypothetical protein P3X46_010329 [Hevea brasiliensis]|uniref:Phytocyanin domain-containing protein n=1 Tax=Hevea brasiliensis TaxID=3981 RepID=A0ABQ9MHS8_HEVBR|nr:early nodulin-like protein 20 [Hevea brasiliensis]KAJ9178449.1 hypothetical protein P3X46_010329 [Hevea brasiliensis]
MEVLSSRKELLWLMMVIVIFAGAKCRQPVLHRVGGGKYAWKPNINFTDWASHEQFYVGDWLYFGFNISCYNVLEVNKTSYDRCIDKNFIKNVTKGGRDVFNLTEAKPYYFINSGDYCFKGMKLALCVENAPPDPTYSLLRNSSTKIYGPIILLPLLGYVAVRILFVQYV